MNSWVKLVWDNYLIQTKSDVKEHRFRLFRDYFQEWYDSLTFWEKAQYHWIDFWATISVYFQIYTHKWFGIDWSNKDDEFEGK